jgi:membrane AbrB-like protein
MDGEIMAGIAFLFIVGIAGWKLFSFFRFPSPDMLGALFLAAGLGMFGIRFEFPTQEVTFVCKLVIGAFLGLKIDRGIFRELRKMLLPALLVSAWMLVLSVTSGFLLYWGTHLPLSTALLGSTTGGISEMALLAFSLDADSVAVTLLQLFRVVLFLILMPFLARSVSAKIKGRRGASLEDDETPSDDAAPGTTDSSGVTVLILVAIAGGLSGRALGIPAGDLLGSMAAVGVFNVVKGGLPGVHPTLRSLARVGVGLAIAQEVTPKTLTLLSEMLLPVSILAVVMILSGLLLSIILYKVTDWSYNTCLLVSSPGGLTQMSIIADEVGADPLTVSVLHTVRLISVLAVLPLFFRFLMG